MYQCLSYLSLTHSLTLSHAHARTHVHAHARVHTPPHTHSTLHHTHPHASPAYTHIDATSQHWHHIHAFTGCSSPTSRSPVSCCCRSSGERSGWLDTSTSIAFWKIQLHKWKNDCSWLILVRHEVNYTYKLCSSCKNVFFTHIMFKGDVIWLHK